MTSAETTRELTPNEIWERDFPKSWVEADERFKSALAKYEAYVLPEGPFPDTKTYSMVELLEQREFRHQYPIPGELPFFDTAVVPTELRDWALEKARLARELYRAVCAKSIYEERRMKDWEIAAFGVPNTYYKDKAWEKKWDEVIYVMSGEFNIDITDGKPVLRVSGHGELFVQAMDIARNRREKWMNRFKGRRIENYPKLVTALWTLSRVPEALFSGNKENVFLAYYVEWWQNKLREEK